MVSSVSLVNRVFFVSEGFAHRFNGEFIQFLFVSITFASELQSHIHVVLDRLISQDAYQKIHTQAHNFFRLISRLISYLKNNEKRHKQKKPEKFDKQESL